MRGIQCGSKFWSKVLSSLINEPSPDTGIHPNAQPRTRMGQLALQCAAAFAVLSLAWPYFDIRDETLPWPATALAIGGVALLIAIFTHQPWWWRLIHALFAPLAWSVAALSIEPGWFLLAFIFLLLLYRGAVTGQIPLFLSNKKSASALAALTSERPGMRFIDLGAGVGSVLRPLARSRRDAQFTGIENAPAAWLAGYLWTAGLANCDWRWGDFWRVSLAEYDVVYVFLSPAPMPALWEKVLREMPSGSLLVSNSFPVPGVEVDQVIEVGDARRTRLYCYRR